MSAKLFYLLSKAEAAHIERATRAESGRVQAGEAGQEPGAGVDSLMSPDHVQYLAAVDAADRAAVQALDIVLPAEEIASAPPDAMAPAEAQLAAAAEEVDAMTCGICTAEQLNTVLIDCGHLSACSLRPRAYAAAAFARALARPARLPTYLHLASMQHLRRQAHAPLPPLSILSPPYCQGAASVLAQRQVSCSAMRPSCCSCAHGSRAGPSIYAHAHRGTFWPLDVAGRGCICILSTVRAGVA